MTGPIEYWRQNKTWSDWLGKTGKVVAVTTIRVASHQRSLFIPYDLVLVDFGRQKHSFMGAGNENFKPGDKVHCVLRKLAQPAEQAIIPYGIKVTKDLCQEK